MVRAKKKKTIAKALGKDSTDYMMVASIIDNRWSCQLHHPLHAAGYYFNPEFYCTNPDIENNKEVSDGLIECIKRLVPNKQKQDSIMKEMVIWVNQEGSFGLEMAKRGIGNIAPAEWWKLYGKGTPNIQHVAIKVLSLTCSSSGCERNFSAFEHIHSKKRNRLEHKKLHDIVFVRYNKTLQNRRDKNVAYDPISLDNIDACNEWLVGRMEEDVNDEAKDEYGVGEVRGRKSSQPSSSRALVDETSKEDIEDEPEADYQPEVDGNYDEFDNLDD
ncbi:uncharacterized protein LOC110882240 [Helianthus annuus]|uniref:uncharacterized protein LOC110882240 n=1 Tax=Helianthus annuus TaxID=4232 RepID=UPI000B8FD86C|nr:uncharacterized protein LOC110882240 [Helianthus annuus]